MKALIGRKAGSIVVWDQDMLPPGLPDLGHVLV